MASTTESKSNVDVEALNLLAQGKRHFLVHDYYSAVQSFEDACKLLDKKYGVCGDECGEAYLKYGSALLELHRQETGALDDVVSKFESEEDDEEENEEEEDDNENTENTEVDTENKNSISIKNLKNEEDITSSPCCSKEVDDNNIDVDQPSTSSGITDKNREIEEEEEEDKEPSNIEIAYEVLLMAKSVFKRQLEYRDDVYLKLAETLQKLGEIFIEWDNKTKAISELEECLKIRQRVLPDDDRLIAETYYYIGFSHSINLEIELANNNFKKVIDVIEIRIKKQQEVFENATSDEEKEKLNIEIEELKSILPEMKNKIEDIQDQMSTAKLADKFENVEKLEEEKVAEKKKKILSNPISNVSHLVKRKRDDLDEIKDKKFCTIATSNGTSKSTSNGHNKVDEHMEIAQ